MISIAGLFLLTLAQAPDLRVAVILDDPAPGGPGRAAIEARLQQLGYRTVDPGTVARLRKVLTPEAILASRLPEGLSVFEADAVVGGTLSYGEPQATPDDPAVQIQTVELAVRLVALDTGEVSRTFSVPGAGMGAMDQGRRRRALQSALSRLFAVAQLPEALETLGPRGKEILLVVHGVPDRSEAGRLSETISTALAGAPVREEYFAKGLVRFVVGGGSARVMEGPSIADLLVTRRVGLRIDEVANTRVVATFDPARAVRIHALVLEPKARSRQSAQALGRFLATELAEHDFARASYQPGRISRPRARRRAQELGADVVVESELIRVAGDRALSLRVIDVATGKPIYRSQRRIDSGGALQAAEQLMAAVTAELPALRSTAPGTDGAATHVSPAIVEASENNP
ncbi:MAG: hypothetical protein AAFZ18_28855 [Myxococcota bacterium]